MIKICFTEKTLSDLLKDNWKGYLSRTIDDRNKMETLELQVWVEKRVAMSYYFLRDQRTHYGTSHSDPFPFTNIRVKKDYLMIIIWIFLHEINLFSV